MANKALRDFITAENTLDGNEYSYISQDDKTRKITLEKIKNFIIGEGTLMTADKTNVINAINEIKTEQTETVYATEEDISALFL